MAPSRSVLLESGTIRSKSKSMMLPKPSHSGQAPNGLLKLYSRGSGMGYVRPQSSHVNSLLNVNRHHGRSSSVNDAPPPVLISGRVGESMSTTHLPLPLEKAVSNESRSRCGGVGAVKRSTITMADSL